MSYKYELIRKLIHISNLIIPLLLFYYDRYFVLLVLVPISIVFIFFDYLRINNHRVANFYNKYFSMITRDFESNRLTGASYVFFSSSVIIYIFPKEIAILSLLIMSISDSMAAIIGQKYGKVKIFEKTLEGTTAFFLSSILLLLLFRIQLFPGILAIVISTLVESSNFLRIDDNLSVPLSFSISYSAFAYLFNIGII